VVQVSQSVETELGDPSGLELAARGADLPFDTVNEGNQLPRIEGALVGGAVEARQQLVSIERLAVPVALDHLESLGDRSLVGGEAVAAERAFATPANGAVRDSAGLEGLRWGVAAGTVHCLKSTEV
jgi:hypothetical protein